MPSAAAVLATRAAMASCPSRVCATTTSTRTGRAFTGTSRVTAAARSTVSRNGVV